MIRRAPRPAEECVAIVHSRDGVHLVASGAADAALAKVAEYVRCRAAHQLWPHEAVQLHDLLEQRRIGEAVEFYFAHVGDRWDPEHLAILPPEPL